MIGDIFNPAGCYPDFDPIHPWRKRLCSCPRVGHLFPGETLFGRCLRCGLLRNNPWPDQHVCFF